LDEKQVAGKGSILVLGEIPEAEPDFRPGLRAAERLTPGQLLKENS
jgi:hypothetical protein